MPSLRARIAAEEIAAQHAVFDDHAALPVRTPSSSNSTGGQPFADVGDVFDVDMRGKHRLVELVEQKRGFAVQVAAD